MSVAVPQAETTLLASEAPLDALAIAERPADLQAVLAAWQGATSRLEQTHEALRAEVQRLTDELEIKNRALARKNRLADLGQIASHVAHEVRNNLVPVSLYLSLLRRRLAADAASLDVLAKVEAGVLALDAAVNDLLGFAGDREPRLAPVRLATMTADVLASVAPQLVAQKIVATTDVSSDHVANIDGDMMRRALLNLVLNALDAMPAGGELHVASHADGGDLILEVADRGPGLTDEAMRRAFEPFFTTKGTGTGLGLAIVYRACEAHGAEATVRNRPDGGAAFTIRLSGTVKPRIEEAA